MQRLDCLFCLAAQMQRADARAFDLSLSPNLAPTASQHMYTVGHGWCISDPKT